MRISRKQRRARQRRQQEASSVKSILTKGVQLAAAAILAWHGLAPLPIHAMPANGQVTAGSAVISQAGAVMTIQQQTAQAAINWQAFNIAANEKVQFFQPGSNSVALNRVLGNNPSAIFGQLTANGKVFLVNPNGVFFAPGAQVNVGGLVASTLSITDADFLAGRYTFANQGSAQGVINQGTIIASNQGLVALLAPEVRNEGIIVAKKGTVVLAAGNQATLDFTGDGRVQLALEPGALQAIADNKGLIEADGGVVLMTARAGQDLTTSIVNQSGIIRARSLDGVTGAVTLHAVDGTVQLAGTVDASGAAAKGGAVDVFGKAITLASNTQLDISGSTGGGKVRVGGDWQGAGNAPHAKTVGIEQGAVIKADAITTGKGGTVAVWSDGTTRFDGAISAQGGANGGDGGNVETSGHVLQVGTGSVNAAAVKGKGGEWLLDPTDITIGATGDTMPGGGTYQPGSTSTVQATTINSVLDGGTSVTIKTVAGDGTGTITVGSAITKTAGSDATLTLQAHQDIIVNADIKSTDGKLNVDLNADTDTTAGGRVVLSSMAVIDTNGGWATLRGGDAVTNSDGSVSGSSKKYAANQEESINPGVDIQGNITTKSGNITIYGETTSKTTSGAAGISIAGELDSGGGNISLNGSISGASNTVSAVTVTGTVNAGAGSVTITGDRGAGTEGTGIRIDAIATKGITAKNVTLIADTMDFANAGAGTIKSNASGTGTIWLKPLTASRNINVGTGVGTGSLDLTKAGLFTSTFQLFKETKIGHQDGTGTITVNNATFYNDVTLQAKDSGGNIKVNDLLSTTGGTIALIAGSDSGGTGTISANALKLEGAKAAFDLQGSNAITTLTGNVKSVKFAEDGGFNIGDGTNGLVINGAGSDGNSTLTVTNGNLNIQNDITKKTGADTTDLTVNALQGTVTVKTGATIKADTGKLNVNLNASTLNFESHTAVAPAISANGGNITLKADAMTLPVGAVGGIVKSAGGVLNIDTLTSAKTIDLGGSSGGALNIRTGAFGKTTDAVVFSDGFSQINIGHVTAIAGEVSTSANAGTVKIANNHLLTVTDPLYIKATTSINLGENSGIDSSGGIANNGNALTLDAPTISFPGSGTGVLYTGNAANNILKLRADAITGWDNARFKTTADHGNTGKLFIEPKTISDFTIGGISGLVTSNGLVNIGAGNFKNVTIGKETGTGTVTISDIGTLPAYTTILKPQGSAVITGDIHASLLPNRTLVFKTGSLTQNAGKTLTVDKLLLLGGATGAFSLTAGTNKITTVAAELEKGIMLTTTDNLAVGTVPDGTGETDRNVDGITAKTGNVKLTVAKTDGTLTLDQKVYSGTDGKGAGRITLVADELGFASDAAGKVRTSGVLQLYPYTASHEINIGSGSNDGLNIGADKFVSGKELGGNYDKIILGRLTSKSDDADQTGNINIGSASNTTTFTSDLELRTTATAKLDGRVNVGTTNPWKDLTITADKATLPQGSSLYVNDLNLNLASGLDLAANPALPDEVGKVDGTGALVVVVPTGKDIYISNAATPSGYVAGSSYKIPYATINEVFTGFPSFGVTGDRNVYFDAGSINKSVTVKAGAVNPYGVTIRENVGITGDSTKLNIEGGHFTMNSGTKLNVTGNNATIDIKATAGDITLSDAVDAATATKLTVDGKNAAINLTASGKVNLGNFAEATISGTGANVTVTGDEFVIGSNAVINLGTDEAGNFTLNANKLIATAANADAITNITGKGTLTLSTRDAGTTLDVNATGAGSGLVVTQAQLNGGLFGGEFKNLILGNKSGTGLVTVDGVSLNNNVTIQNGSAGEIKIGSNDLSVAADKKVTLKAGSISNSEGTGSITVGIGGTINLYTNKLTDLKDDNGDTAGGSPTVIGSGTLGIATYDGTVDISLGNTSHGGLHLSDSKFNTVFGNGFSAYEIGNSDQKNMHVHDSTLSQNTSLTANNIYFYPNTAAGNSINVGTNTLTVNAATQAMQNGGIITANNLALTGGNFNLQGNNAITTLAGQAKSVEVKSASPLTIGTVGSLNGIDTTSGGANGNITLTADTMTFIPGTAVKGNGVLTVQQASADRKLNIGTNPDGMDALTGALYLGTELFGGTVFKDGFQHVYLGNENSIAEVKIGGTLSFVDPTTIRSHKKQANALPASTDSITLAADAQITTTSGSSLEFITTKLTTTAGSTITTGGDLTLTVDNMDLAGNNAVPPIRLATPESSKLYIQTMSKDRDLGLGNFANNIDQNVIDPAKRRLVLQSTYFDGIANPEQSLDDPNRNQRVFADGYSQIVLGRTDGTGTLYQSGTTGFTDEVVIRQASDNSTGSVNVTGVINTGGNAFTVESKVVNITDANIDASNPDSSKKGGTVSLTADSLTIKDSTIKSEKGDLIIKTFTDTTKINIGGNNTSNPNDLNLESKWFDGGNRVFKDGFDNINIGSAGGKGTIEVKDNFSVTDNLTLKNGTGSVTLPVDKTLDLNGNDLTITTTTGTVNIPGTITEVKTLEITTGSSITLNNSNNTITNIGNVTAVDGIDIKDKDGVTITGTVKNTGAGKDVTIHTTGNITIGANGTVQSKDDVFLVAENGYFINGNNDANPAIKTEPGGEWVVYTKDPTGNTPGDLATDTDFHRYGTEYGDKDVLIKTPGVSDYSGSGFAYNYRPKAVIYGEKIYGSDNVNFFTGSQFAVTVGSTANTWEQDFLNYLNSTGTLAGKTVKDSSNYTTGTGLGAANVNTSGPLYGSSHIDPLLSASYKGANPFNYEVDIQLKVTPKDVTVTANNHSKTYNGTNYVSGTHGVSYSGFITGQDVTNAGINAGTSVSYGGSAVDAKNAGSYVIDIYGDLAANNYIFTYAEGALNINKKTVTVGALNDTKVYDGKVYDANKEAKYSGFITGEDKSVITGGSLGYTGSATTAINVGTGYTIDLSGDLTAQNYKFQYQDGTLSITPKAVTVTANGHDKVYDGLTYTNGTHGVSYDGFVDGEDKNVITGGSVSYGGSASTAVNVGDAYGININNVNSNLAASNYTFTYEDGNLKITPATLNVTANNANKVYDGKTYTGGGGAYGASYTGFVNNETTAVLGGTLGYSGASQGAVDVNAGGYAITPGGLTANNGNYTINFVNGTLTVTPAPLTITANGATKVYDGQGYNGGNGVTYDGFVNGETTTVLDGALGYDGTSQGAKNVNVGGYTITPGGLSNGNYAITYENGTLTITPRPITVTVDDATRYYGHANPTGLGGQVTGGTLVAGDTIGTIGVAVDPSATPTANAGTTHNIAGQNVTFATGEAGNYSVTYVDGKLVITGLNPTDKEAIEGAQTTKPTNPAPVVPGGPGASPGQPSIQPDPGTAPPVNTGIAPGLPNGITGDIQTGGSSNQTTFVTENGGISLRLNRGNSDSEGGIAGARRTSGAVPVLYAGSGEQKLDGIYTINYSPDNLSILPSAQSVTIPRLEEVAPDVHKGFSIIYKTDATGSFEVAFGNGIVTIHPLDQLAMATVKGQNKEAGKAVFATGVLTAVEDLGVMPDQIRAICIFTEQK